MKRKKTALLILGILLIAGGLSFLFIAKRSGITRGTYDQVLLGMTEQEVISGLPIRERVANRQQVVSRKIAKHGTAHFKDDEIFVKKLDDGSTAYFDRQTGNNLGKVRWWDTERHSLVVVFDRDGLVMGKLFMNISLKQTTGLIDSLPLSEHFFLSLGYLHLSSIHNGISHSAQPN